MSTLTLDDLTPHLVQRLVDTSAPSEAVIDEDTRRALAASLQTLPVRKSRVDAWTIEQGGAPERAFRWTPAGAKRTLGRGALAGFAAGEFRTMVDAVRGEVDRLVQYAASSTYPSSLALWLASTTAAARALAVAHAVTWATESWMLLDGVRDVRVVTADTYHQIPGTSVTLRGGRDAVIGTGATRTLVRVRSGLPAATAGSGLRADLTVDALAHPLGLCAARAITLWPDAGLALSVTGSDETIRRGVQVLTLAAHHTVTNHEDVATVVAPPNGSPLVA